MNPIVLKPIFAAAVLAAGCALANVAWAQYVWVDGKGVKQYSDMPPPPSVPAASILKTPRSATGMHAAAAPAAETADGTAAGKAKAPPSTADKNAEFTKRRTEQAEQEKKAAEQSRIAAEKARSCERARQYQKTLASGVRIASTDKNGERVFLDDAQRAQEEQETRSVLKECGSAG